MKGYIWTILTIILLSVAISFGIIKLRAAGIGTIRPLHLSTNAPAPSTSR